MKHKLATLPIKTIEPENRFRKDFGDLETLKTNISEHGLIQPVAVMATDSKDKYILLAGERRLRSCIELEWESIPAKIFPANLDEYQRRAIELSENVHRKDMSYQEEVALIAEIHELHVKIHGEAHGKRTDLGDEGGWSYEKTAELVGKSTSSVVKDIYLHKGITSIPELGEEKTKNDAYKRLKGLKETVDRSIRAEELQKKAAKTPDDIKRKKLIDSFIIGDVGEGLESLPDKSVDFIEFDPPYGIDLGDLKKRNFTSERAQRYHDIPQDEYPDWLLPKLKECYRVLKNDRWIVLWFAPHPWEAFPTKIGKKTYKLNLIQMWLEEAGFTVRPLRGIWSKLSGQTQQPLMSMANAHECFYYAAKGNPKLKWPGRISTFQFWPVDVSKKTNDAERPIEMYSDIVKTFCEEGWTICSPCVGSGNIILAANNRNCECFGWDNEEDNKNAFVVKVDEGEPGNYRSYKNA